MVRMVKELIGSIRKDGAKYRLERDEDCWSVRTDRQLFRGSLEDLDEFCKEKGLLFLIPEDKVEEGLEEIKDKLETANVKLVDEEGEETTVEEVFEKVVESAEEVLEEALEIAEEVVVEAITAEPEPEVTVKVKLDTTEAEATIAQLQTQIEELKKKEAE